MEEESTLRLDIGAPKVPWIESDLEVLVIDAQGRESIWPITRASMQVGSASNPRPNDIVLDGSGAAERQAVLQVRNQNVMFLNFDQRNPAKKGGKAITYCEFLPGEQIEVDPTPQVGPGFDRRDRVAAELGSLAAADLSGLLQPFGRLGGVADAMVG